MDAKSDTALFEESLEVGASREPAAACQPGRHPGAPREGLERLEQEVGLRLVAAAQVRLDEVERAHVGVRVTGQRTRPDQGAEDPDRASRLFETQCDQPTAERDPRIACRVDEHLERRVAVGVAARRRDVGLGPDEVVELRAVLGVEREGVKLGRVRSRAVPVAEHDPRDELERGGEEQRRYGTVPSRLRRGSFGGR